MKENSVCILISSHEAGRELGLNRNEEYEEISYPQRIYLHDMELLLAGAIDQPLQYLQILFEITEDATRRNLNAGRCDSLTFPMGIVHAWLASICVVLTYGFQPVCHLR
jgi:hypothetical protein